MPSKFQITAAVAIKAIPQSQLNAITNQLNKAFGNVKANINVNIPRNVSAQITSINKGLASTAKSAAVATSEIEKFGKMTALAVRRFAAFAVGTSGFLGLAYAMKKSFEDAVKFDREMVRVAQVTDQSMKSLKALKSEITGLATGLGVSSDKLSKVAVTLAQAGLSAEDTGKALKVLAKTELAATFDDIGNTTEGVIAILSQFGGDINKLEGQLSSLNSVSAKFAVESEDIVKAIRLTGGAFHAAGGNLNELMALFTSVRATTRESADSIATGFRTIFGRLQRPKTIEYLHEMGIELRDLNKQFVGPYEAVRRLSAALNSIPSTDPRFAAIIEEVGGLRQQSRVIPLIQEVTKREQAYNVAMRESKSLSENAAQAQQALSVQLTKVKEEFDALFRKLSDDAGIRGFISTTLSLAKALIQLTDSLTPLIPLLGALGTVKLFKSLPTYFGGIKGEFQYSRRPYASGGHVPGIGSGDSVPAMLTPGEFVLTKNAVSKIGVNNLNRVNRIGFATGGKVPDYSRGAGGRFVSKAQREQNISDALARAKYEQEEADAAAQLQREAVESAAAKRSASRSMFNKRVGDIPYSESASLPQTSSGLRLLRHKTQQSAATGGVGDFRFKSEFVRSTNKLAGDKGIELVNKELTATGKILKDFGKDIKVVDDIVFKKDRKGQYLKSGNLEQIGINPKNATVSTAIHEVGHAIDKYVSVKVGAKRFASEVPGNIFHQIATEFKKERLEELTTQGKSKKYISYAMQPQELFATKYSRMNRVERISLLNIVKRKYNREANPMDYLTGGSMAGTGTSYAGTGSTHSVMPYSPFYGSGGGPSGGGLSNRKFFKSVSDSRVGKVISSAAANPMQALMGIGIVNYLISDLKGLDDSVKKAAMGVSSFAAQALIFKTMIGNAGIPGAGAFVTAQKGRVLARRQVERSQEAVQHYSDRYQYYSSAPKTPRNLNKKLSARIALDNALESLQVNQATYNRRTTRARRLGIMRGIGTGLNTAAPALLAGGMMAGDYFSNRGSSLISAGDYTSGRSNVIGGSVLSGATTGAIMGGAIGSIIPGVGTAIGAGVGAVGGAIYGHVSGASEAKKQVLSKEYGAGLESLGRELKGNELNPSALHRQAITGKYNDLYTKMEKAEINKETDSAEIFKDKLKEVSPAIEKFINEQVQASSSMSEFYDRTKNLAFTFAKVNNISDEDYIKSIKSQVDANNALKESNLKVIKSTQDLADAENQLASFSLSVSEKFRAVGERLDVLGNSINGVVSLSNGTVSNVHTVAQTGALGNLAAASTANVRSQANYGASILGGKFGGEVANETTAMSSALKMLPSMLGQILPSNLTDFKDIGNDIKGRLINAGHDKAGAEKAVKFIQDSLINDLGDISGPNRGEVIQKLQGTGRTHLVSRISKDYEQNNVLSGAIEGDANLQNTLGGYYGSRRGLRGLRQEQLGGLFGARFGMEDLGARFAERRLSTDRIISRQQGAEGLAFGIGNGATFGQQLIDAQNQIGILNEKKKGVKTFQEEVEINQELERMNDVAANASKALAYFSDAAKRSAVIQDQLNKLENERKDKLNLGKTLAFGAPTEKMALIRTLSGAAQVANNPNAFGQMPQMMQKEIFEFFEQRGDQMFAGRQSNDILKDLAKQVGLGTLVNPSDEENKLRGALMQIQQDEVDALRANVTVTTNAITATNDLITEIRGLVERLPNVINPQQRNRGGLIFANGGKVPGAGNRDTVPAMLTPGEFVLNKQAVNDIGVNNLHALNFANGGQVPNYRNPGPIPPGRNRYAYKRQLMYQAIAANRANNVHRMARIDQRNRQAIINQRIIDNSNARGLPGQKLNTTINLNGPGGMKSITGATGTGFRFSGGKAIPISNKGVNYVGGLQAASQNLQNAAAPMVQAMNAFPRTIDMNANHKVEVVINGAQVLTSIIPQIQGLIESEAKRMINKMIKDKLPDLGQV